MPDSRYVPVVAADAIADKSFECFDAEGRSVVICRFRDEYYALENRCSHALATFDDGRMRGPRLMCPLHGASFDIRDGSCKGPPATQPIASFQTRIADGMVEVLFEE
ncbi:MAG TPA: Rieske 2Fe-2S domain-containing protein [Xanthomonadales bacterium]|nr:Rieske 2Fe-2S domain-containing protein [Xanthomonadales bacterium]